LKSGFEERRKKEKEKLLDFSGVKEVEDLHHNEYIKNRCEVTRWYVV
jgi:hypothetical protein